MIPAATQMRAQIGSEVFESACSKASDSVFSELTVFQTKISELQSSQRQMVIDRFDEDGGKRLVRVPIHCT